MNIKSFFLGFFDKTLILIAGGILIFRWALFEPYVIPSGSMIPSLLIYDHIIVNKMSYGVRWPFSKKWIWKRDTLKRGEVVVFRPVKEQKGMKFMVKRVVGLPGDRIYIDEAKQLWLNGEKVARARLSAEDQGKTPPPPAKGTKGFSPITERDLGASFEDYHFYLENLPQAKPYRILQEDNNFFRLMKKEFIVPKGFVFVMGDNRDKSQDSRFWGALPLNHIMGKAVLIWLSCEDTFFSLPLFCHPDKIRFSRLLKTIR